MDRNRIEASKQRLMGMGYFEKVEIAAVGADALNEKDVQIRVQEKEGRYNFRRRRGRVGREQPGSAWPNSPPTISTS